MFRKLAFFILAAGTMGSPAVAQSYPEKPVVMLVPSAAGGPVDGIARIVAEGMQAVLGQPVVVENRDAGGGVVAAETVARATPDGYTVMTAAASTMIFTPLMSTVNFDTQKDFKPVTLIATLPTVLVVNSSLGVNSMEELIALAKKDPGKLTYGTAGAGSASHLSAELLKLTAGIDVLHIPYKGAPQAATGLLAGEVDMFFSGPVNVLPNLQNGKLKALFVADKQRNDIIPDVPTAEEAGVGDVVVLGTFGIYAPAATPDEIVTKLDAAARKAIENPDAKTKLVNLGYALPMGGPAQFRDYISQEIGKWKPVIESAAIKLN